MDICIAAPIATADIAHLLTSASPTMPTGYTGAPLIGVLIEQLLHLGHKVHAITVDYKMPADARAMTAHGERLTFEVIPGRRRAWRFENGRLGRALDLFRDERAAICKAIVLASPDIVHAHWTYEFALGALDSRLPHVITAHDSPKQIVRYTRSPYRMLRWIMARHVLRHAQCVTTVSGYMAEEIQQMARTQVQVIPNPIKERAFELGRNRTGPLGQRVGMICNGWNAWKNPEAALRAFAILRERLPGAELYLFGRDFAPGEHAERWCALNIGAKGLHFCGSMSHAELLQRMNDLDLLLHPALEESFGVVVAEAMSLGVPVIAGLHSGAVPWVAGSAQWLVDVTSPSLMADAMTHALTSPDAYARASSAGRTRATRMFAPPVVTQKYLNTYAATLSRTALTGTP